MPIAGTERFRLAYQSSGDINDSEEEECRQAREFQECKPELCLTKSCDTKHLKCGKDEPEDQEPAPKRDRVRPISQHAANDIVLICQNLFDQPFASTSPAARRTATHMTK